MSDDDDREPQFDASGAPLSRRTLLKTTAGAVLAAAGSGLACRQATAPPTAPAPTAPAPGQEAGWSYNTPGGTIPFKRPLGLLPDIEGQRKEFVSNLEIHSVLEINRGVSTADGAACPLWVRGTRRLLQNGVDITDPKKPFVAQEAMPGGVLNYVNRLKKWVVLGSAGLGQTSPSPEYPWGHYAGPDAEPRTSQYFQDNYVKRAGQFRGLRAHDVTDPTKPVLLSEFSTGKTGLGTHASMWDGGKYMYLMSSWDESLRQEAGSYPFSYGLQIVDVSDPANIKDVAKWWAPGQKYGEEEEYKKWPFAGNHMGWTGNHGGAFVPRRVEDGGKVGYCGMGVFGMYVLDLSDITKPKVLGRVSHPMEPGYGSIPYHTCMPIETGQSDPSLVIGVDEECVTDGRGPWHPSYIINVKDPRNPKIIGLFPRPIPPKDAPYADFALARGRFGTHNSMSWSPPGAPRADITALTHFIAGLRIYDIRDPTDPKEVAWYVPARYGQMKEWTSWRRSEPSAFIEWDRNLIWMADTRKLYCMSTPLLGKPVLEPRKVERWAVPHVNVGWDDQTPKSVSFGRPLSRMTSSLG